MSVPPVLLRTFEEVLNIFDQYPEAHIVIGYGSKIQYHDLDAVIDELGSWLRNAQKRCGSKPWLLIYGGDMAKEDVHDVGLLVQRMAATFACRVVAPWVSSAADPPPPQPFVNYYYVMEPQYAGDLEGARQLQQQQQQQQQGQSPLSINISLAAHSRDAASRYAGKRSFVEGVGDNSTDEDVNGHLKQRRRLGDNASLQQQESVGQQPSQEQDSFAQTEMAGSKEEQPTEGVPGSIPEPLPVDRVLTAIDDPVDASTRDGNASIMFNPELESAPEPDGASLPLPNTAKPAVRQQQPAEPLSNISITGTTRLEPAGQGKGASSGRGRQLWGGIIDGRPVGPSQFYLNDIMLGQVVVSECVPCMTRRLGGGPHLWSTVVVSFESL
ncbi:hypothetical protein Vretimale_6083 [Volvox reticuliferus]|uniref:Uncharacterized protein n=1 Tax=Volvox reticuliferus TaxID=1737510 RepID=A0A8J4G705_9CHLO|nr:hypothetical protein Vretimale_6083 [Volvox reticuliferus]